MDKHLIDCLYEQLINLDEQAGCFDEDTNAMIDLQRAAVLREIKELEEA